MGGIDDGRRLYSDAAGRPRLRDSFVTYIDELGTSERIAGMTDEDLRDDLEAYDRLRWFIHDDAGSIPESDSKRTLYFSDNLVSVSPISSDPLLPDGGLIMHIGAAASYQLNMALRGRALRGAICAGAVYADDSYVTGPAHLEAVGLEEQVADTPRIIVDDSCLEFVRTAMDPRNSGYATAEESEYQGLLLRDADGRAFLHYLSFVAEDGPDDIDAGLALHRSNVEHALAASRTNWKVHAKHLWRAAYHNHTCRTDFGREHHTIADVPRIPFTGIAPTT